MRRPERDIDDPGWDDQDPAHRMTVNLLAMIVALLLLCAGFWLVWHLAENRKIQDCLTSGFRNCSPLQRFSQGPTDGYNPASRSISAASLRSSSVRPSASWVESVTSTVL